MKSKENNVEDVSIPDHPNVIVFCDACFATNSKVVVFYGNPYLFKCPICGGQVCSNLKLHLKFLETQIHDHHKLTILLQEADVWGKKLEEGQYYYKEKVED